MKSKKTLFFFFALCCVGLVLFQAHPLAWIEKTVLSAPKVKTRIQVKEAPPPPPVLPKAVVSKSLLPQSPQMQMPTFSGATYGQGGTSGLRVGDGAPVDAALQEARNETRPPQPQGQVKIEYPLFAKSKNLKGFVVVQALIGLSGVVEKIQILSAEPAGVFDQYVISEIRKWKFIPGLENGQVRAQMWTQRVRFDYD